LEHAETQATEAGVPFVVARARRTLLEMVEDRHASRPGVPSFPSASNRQCTSDLKRGPIMREVRRYAVANGHRIVVNCMGLRAQESPGRAKAETWARNARGSVAGREWFDWLPIHPLTTDEVFGIIADAGQEPHPAYGQGNQRLSCVFCILTSAADARNGAIRRPELFERYVELERRTGYTAHQSRKGLEELTGLSVADAYRLHVAEGSRP
jgi:3'-phosphoadenosine 5'-phosphosulfate sulfotransferase (PAPS reductase)/FAD synthetase